MDVEFKQKTLEKKENDIKDDDFVSMKDPAAIQEFGNTFNWVLPSIDQAVHKPYAYQLLFKSVTFDIPYDEEGNINLLDLKDRNFALSIEKKCFDNGEIVPRIVNLIAYSD